MERGVRVTRLDGVPDFSKFSRGDDEGFVKREGPRLDKPYKDNKPFSKDGPRSDKPFNKDKPAGAKPYGDAPRKDWKAKPAGANVDRRVDDEVWGEKPKSNFAKKPGDKPFNKAGGDKPFKKPAPKGGFDKRK
jgi:ATP-dependent RNA helicase DeaD